MKKQTLVQLILLCLLAAALVACGASMPEEAPVAESSGDYQSAPIAVQEAAEEPAAAEPAAESVEVTRVVTETEMVVAEDAATAAQEAAPIAVSPVDSQRIDVAPTAVPPRDTFFQDYGVNPFVLTSVDNLSTFSLDVDTGSYTIARNYIQDGLTPPPDAIRVEEFVNAFDQGYANPPNTAFAIYADGAPSPFHNDGTIFLRIGVQGYDVAEADRKSAAFTFVIDVSGSMEGSNRLGLVKESLNLLVDRMREDDTVAIVVYGSEARVVLEPTAGSRRGDILTAIYSLQTEGSTNMEAGLLLGYEMANWVYKPGGINRVVLASDGVANVGDTSANSLAQKIRGYADSGITLTTIGFGMDNYNDIIMEQLADQGDGNYAYVDTYDEAQTLFVDNLMSTIQVIGLDAKIQVEFDRNVVERYRLVGYENRAIADQDFRNDSVDAGEIGAGHTATAVYAVQLYPGAVGRIATVNLRWQDPDSRRVQEISGNFGTANLAPSFDDAPLHYQLAVVVSQYAELLRHSYWADGLNFEALRIRSQRLASQLGTEEVVELAGLVERSSRQ